MPGSSCRTLPARTEALRSPASPHTQKVETPNIAPRLLLLEEVMRLSSVKLSCSSQGRARRRCRVHGPRFRAHLPYEECFNSDKQWVHLRTSSSPRAVTSGDPWESVPTFLPETRIIPLPPSCRGLAQWQKHS